MHDLGAIQALHHALADLARYDRAALVIEAQYADFLDLQRLEGRWPAAYLAKAIAEMTALHPSLPVIFAGNRNSRASGRIDFSRRAPPAVRRRSSSWCEKISPSYGPSDRVASLDELLRAAVMNEVHGPFAVRDLAARFDGMTESRVRRVLKAMERDGKVRCLGR